MTAGGHSLAGQNPVLIRPAAGHNHLAAGSPGVDHGTDAGVHVDYDRDPRPVGGMTSTSVATSWRRRRSCR